MRSTAVRMGMLAGIALVAACEGEGVRVSSARLEVSPAVVYFGAVGVGASDSKLVEVRNLGQGVLNVESATIEPESMRNVVSFEEFLQTDCQGGARGEPVLKLSAGSCGRFRLTVSPKAQGPFDAKIRLASDDQERGVVYVDVVGEGVGGIAQACVLDEAGEVAPKGCADIADAAMPALDFGSVVRGERVKRTVRIVNAGRAVLEVTQAQILGEPVPFSTVGSTNSLPFDPTDYAEFQVAFEPPVAGDFEGVLQLLTTDVDRPDLRIPLVGRGTTPQVRVCVLADDESFGGEDCAKLDRDPIETPIVGFPAVALGTTLSRKLRVFNDGDAPLPLRGLSIDAGAPEFQVRLATPGDVAPGSSGDFELVFAPLVEGPRSGRMTVRTGDFETPEISFDMVGRGIAPMMRVCVVELDGSVSPQGCTELSETPPLVPALDFGRVAWFDRSVRKLQIWNDGIAPLIVNGVSLDTPTGELVLVPPSLPLTVPPEGSAELELAFAPTTEGPVQATLLLLSNDTRAPELRLPVRATGEGPKLCIIPATGLDFGRVNQQNDRSLGAIVRNCGLVPYQLKEISLVEAQTTTREFSMTGVPALPLTLAPGGQVDLSLVYKPVAERVDTATLSVRNDYTTVSVPVRGEGAPPSCAAAPPVARISNVAAVRPLQTLTLNGSTSSSPRTGALQYVWRIRSRPTNSTSQLQPQADPAKPKLYADLAGEFVVELVVKDSGGCQSAPVTKTVKVIPDKKIHVQLSWPQDFGDVDLHYIRQGGAYFSNGDAYFGNKTPSWVSGRNPTLDIDDTWGNGPENVSQANPFDGTYKVWIHYYCGRECELIWPFPPVFSCGSARGAVSPTVKIFVDGVEKYSRTLTLSEDRIWEVANITVSGNGQNVSVQGLSTALRGDPDHGCL